MRNVDDNRKAVGKGAAVAVERAVALVIMLRIILARNVLGARCAEPPVKRGISDLSASAIC